MGALGLRPRHRHRTSTSRATRRPHRTRHPLPNRPHHLRSWLHPLRTRTRPHLPQHRAYHSRHRRRPLLTPSHGHHPTNLQRPSPRQSLRPVRHDRGRRRLNRPCPSRRPHHPIRRGTRLALHLLHQRPLRHNRIHPRPLLAPLRQRTQTRRRAPRTPPSQEKRAKPPRQAAAKNRPRPHRHHPARNRRARHHVPIHRAATPLAARPHIRTCCGPPIRLVEMGSSLHQTRQLPPRQS